MKKLRVLPSCFGPLSEGSGSAQYRLVNEAVQVHGDPDVPLPEGPEGEGGSLPWRLIAHGHIAPNGRQTVWCLL